MHYDRSMCFRPFSTTVVTTWDDIIDIAMVIVWRWHSAPACIRSEYAVLHSNTIVAHIPGALSGSISEHSLHCVSGLQP